jgi:hypothetical protein
MLNRERLQMQLYILVRDTKCSVSIQVVDIYDFVSNGVVGTSTCSVPHSATE